MSKVKKVITKKVKTKRVDPSILSNIRWDGVVEKKRIEMANKILKVFLKSKYSQGLDKENYNNLSMEIAKNLITRKNNKK